MKKIETPLDGAFIIEPQVFGDVRGWFYESYSKQKMHDIGIDVEFVQDNRSFSAQQGTFSFARANTSFAPTAFTVNGFSQSTGFP